ncbi:MAG: Rpn family recombination-promoting nuclease/putative transposase [Spirochaetia bacterium]
MQKAHATYKDFTANDELVELAEARMKHIRDQGTLIEGAREEGIEQGIEKGKMEDAQRMLEKDYPIQDIDEITGLSLEEIKKLR